MALSKFARSLAIGVVLSGAGAGLLACSSTQSAGTQVDDAVITTEVKAKLAADPEVAATDIDVDTNEGEVTLSGRVETDEARREALRLARETDGVTRVRDLLKVGDID